MSGAPSHCGRPALLSGSGDRDGFDVAPGISSAAAPHRGADGFGFRADGHVACHARPGYMAALARHSSFRIDKKETASDAQTQFARTLGELGIDAWLQNCVAPGGYFYLSEKGTYLFDVDINGARYSNSSEPMISS